jgi:hypothetical protein
MGKRYQLKKLLKKHIDRKLFFKIVAFFIVGLIVYIPIAGLYNMQPHNGRKIRAEQYLKQIIDSAVNETNFYKVCLEERWNEDLKYMHRLSNTKYEILFIDYDFSMYQYRIIFSNNCTYWADIDFNFWGKPRLFDIWIEPN